MNFTVCLHNRQMGESKQTHCLCCWCYGEETVKLGGRYQKAAIPRLGNAVRVDGPATWICALSKELYKQIFINYCSSCCKVLFI